MELPFIGNFKPEIKNSIDKIYLINKVQNIGDNYYIFKDIIQLILRTEYSAQLTLHKLI